MTFFRLRAGESWARTLIFSGLGIAFMCFMAWVLNRDFPAGPPAILLDATLAADLSRSKLMGQTAIPFLFMRGGTSRGPFFDRADLPDNLDALAETLIAVVGSGHPLNIDGIGGGAAVTTKVAMLSRSDDDWAEIDYFFAQVSVEDQLVDYKPTCGNMLTAVGPAALEMGLFVPKGDVTEVRIRAVNIGAEVAALIQTPGGVVEYQGETAIDGVPGTAAPVGLNFMKVAGSATGALLPTGNLRDEIDGIEVSCMDVAMPVVMARADAFDLTGHETREELDDNKDFFARMEQIRLQAGERMGMGDVTKIDNAKVCNPRLGPRWRVDRRALFHALADPSDNGGHGGPMHCRLRTRVGIGRGRALEPAEYQPRGTATRAPDRQDRDLDRFQEWVGRLPRPLRRAHANRAQNCCWRGLCWSGTVANLTAPSGSTQRL